MKTVYKHTIEALLGIIEQQSQKKPVTGENLQQALLNVEVALDRASTEAVEADRVAELLALREQLLSVEKTVCHAQPSQY